MALSSNRPAVQPLAHRILFPPAQSPRLFATPIPPELHDELYDFLALALRAFVVPWWSKLSRYDRALLPHVARVIALVLRSLETRLLAVHLPTLVCHHVPAILTQHYRDYRNASLKLSTSYASGGAASLPQLFHQLQPHMAVSPDGRLDTEYFRQLVDHLLKVSLPQEDYSPEAERFIVREIILKVLLNDVIPKITQPWFIQKTLLDLLQPPDPLLFDPSPPAPPSSSFSFQTILVLVLSAIQTISGACLALIQAYKQALGTIKHVNNISSDSTLSNYATPPLTMLSEIFTFNHRLASTTLLTTTSIITTLSTSFLDRLLPHLLATYLSPAFLLTTARTAKRTLFPNGYPGPPPPEPSPEEQADIRARLVAWRPTGPLAHLVPLFLGPNPSETLSDALDPLSSAPCNVHLVLLLMDCVFLALFPELGGMENGS